MPLNTMDAGVSPEWTLAVMKMMGFFLVFKDGASLAMVIICKGSPQTDLQSSSRLYHKLLA